MFWSARDWLYVSCSFIHIFFWCYIIKHYLAFLTSFNPIAPEQFDQIVREDELKKQEKRKSLGRACCDVGSHDNAYYASDVLSQASTTAMVSPSCSEDWCDFVSGFMVSSLFIMFILQVGITCLGIARLRDLSLPRTALHSSTDSSWWLGLWGSKVQVNQRLVAHLIQEASLTCRFWCSLEGLDSDFVSGFPEKSSDLHWDG